MSCVDKDNRMNKILDYIFRTDRLYSEYAHKKNITYNRLMVYYAIKTTDSCTQKSIVERWNLPKQTVNTVVQDLKNKKMISLDKRNSKREKTIVLTAQVKIHISNIVDEMVDFGNSALEVLSEKEFEILDSSMNRYLNKFEEVLLEI